MRIVLAALGIALATPSFAGMNCQRIGTFTYCNDTDSGARYSGQQIGNFQYWNQTAPSYNQGYNYQPQRRTCQRIGSYTYCN